MLCQFASAYLIEDIMHCLGVIPAYVNHLHVSCMFCAFYTDLPGGPDPNLTRCLPILQLWNITLQPKVKLLCLGEELPEQQHIGVSCVDELHLHLTTHHHLQPIQHLPHLVYCEGFLHQPSHERHGTYEHKQVVGPHKPESYMWLGFIKVKKKNLKMDVAGHLLSLSSSKHESMVFSLRTLFERANRM